MRNLLLDPKEIVLSGRSSWRSGVHAPRTIRTGSCRKRRMSLAFKAHPYRWPRHRVDGGHPAHRSGGAARVLRHVLPTHNAILSWWGTSPRRRSWGRPPPVRRHRAGTGRAAVGAIEPPQIDERRLIVKKPAPRSDCDLSCTCRFRSATRRHSTCCRPSCPGTGVAPLPEADLERRLALGAGGDYSYFSLNPNLFWLYTTPAAWPDPEVLEQALLAELELVKADPIPRRISSARKPVEASFVWRQDFRALARVGPGPSSCWARGGSRRPPPLVQGPSPPAICTGGARLFSPSTEERGLLLPAAPAAPA